MARKAAIKLYPPQVGWPLMFQEVRAVMRGTRSHTVRIVSEAHGLDADFNVTPILSPDSGRRLIFGILFGDRILSVPVPIPFDPFAGFRAMILLDYLLAAAKDGLFNPELPDIVIHLVLGTPSRVTNIDEYRASLPEGLLDKVMAQTMQLPTLDLLVCHFSRTGVPFDRPAFEAAWDRGELNPDSLRMYRNVIGLRTQEERAAERVKLEPYWRVIGEYCIYTGEELSAELRRSISDYILLNDDETIRVPDLALAAFLAAYLDHDIREQVVDNSGLLHIPLPLLVAPLEMPAGLTEVRNLRALIFSLFMQQFLGLGEQTLASYQDHLICLALRLNVLHIVSRFGDVGKR